MAKKEEQSDRQLQADQELRVKLINRINVLTMDLLAAQKRVQDAEDAMRKVMNDAKSSLGTALSERARIHEEYQRTCQKIIPLLRIDDQDDSRSDAGGRTLAAIFAAEVAIAEGEQQTNAHERKADSGLDLSGR